jgi:hypothetical protein
MLPLHLNRTGLVRATALLGTLALGACSDGVQLEGKIFDWMGVSPSAMASRNTEPKMAARAPLVVPPSVNRLPEPGSGKTSSDELASIKDPEEQKKLSAKERERLHLAYCRGEIQWKQKALDPNYQGNRSPFGPCPGLFGGAADSLTK